MTNTPSRRNFLTAAALTAAGSLAAGLAVPATATAAVTAPRRPDLVEPFHGPHQAGILTAQQTHTYVAAFEIAARDRRDIIAMLQAWTVAAASLTRGRPIEEPGATDDTPAADSGDGLDLGAARLTLTFGFGPGLFVKDGTDRFGLADQRPEAFVDLPKFPGDQLIAQWTGGDLVVQACADDPQVAFHAVRQLARLAGPRLDLRWVQSGFVSAGKGGTTPRNLMGFKDGSGNPPTTDAGAMKEVVWVGSEGPRWMQGGSYVVIRRSRIALEHWDRMKVSFQEQTVGRQKLSGAPLGRTHETDALDLDTADADGNPVLPENSHARLATAASNDGARILRRSYSYNDGVSFVAERWPPWHQGMEYDAGLIFVCYQRDPRTGFIKINEKLSRFDMMNQFVTTVGGGLFACPRGIAEGEYIGQALFEAV